MKGAKRVILGLAGLGMAAALGGCGILRGAGNTATDLNPEDDTYYTMWIHSGPGSSYYTEYEDNPAVKYAETMTWGEEGNPSSSTSSSRPPIRNQTTCRTCISTGT